MSRQEPVYQIPSAPGIARDGTRLDSTSFIDGQWVRFQRGRPKKIGGYKEITKNHDSIVRGATVGYKSGISYIYAFSRNKAYVSTTTADAATSTATVSSLTGLVDSDIYTFQSDTIFDPTGGRRSPASLCRPSRPARCSACRSCRAWPGSWRVARACRRT